MPDANTLEALAKLAWPLIVIVLIILFRPAIFAIIESAKSRRFTVKLGGQELTMEEANNQQQAMIADLQTQVVEIKKKLEPQAAVRFSEEARPAARTLPRAVLWVDDNPKNNSFYVQQLRDKGVAVDLALSTAQGLKLSAQKSHAVIISDMGRLEDGKYRPTAGLDLLRQVRETDRDVPFIIFCGASGKQHAREAMGLKATALTTSGTELTGLLQDALGGQGVTGIHN